MMQHLAGDGATPRTSRLSTVARNAHFADEPTALQQPTPQALSDRPIPEASRQDGYADSQGKYTIFASPTDPYLTGLASDSRRHQNASAS